VLVALRSVTVDGGKIILSIRHGAGAPTRPALPANVEDTVKWAEAAGCFVVDKTTTQSVQAVNHRAGVTWTRMVLQARRMAGLSAMCLMLRSARMAAMRSSGLCKDLGSIQSPFVKLATNVSFCGLFPTDNSRQSFGKWRYTRRAVSN